MKRIVTKAQHHGQKLLRHAHQHHKKYLFGMV